LRLLNGMPLKSKSGKKPKKSTVPIKKNVATTGKRKKKVVKNASARPAKRDQFQQKSNDLLFHSLSQAIRELLINSNTSDAIAKGLQLLGQATQVDRAYLFENDPITPGKPLSISQRYEWNSGTALPQIDNPELQNLPYTAVSPSYDYLSENQPYHQVVRKMDKESSFRKILEAEDIQSLLLFPIFLESQFWGFIGFDECKFERKWTEIEISVLRGYSAAIAAALERLNREKSYKELFDTVGEAIYIQKFDGTFVDVNKYACSMYGYEKEELIGRTPLFLSAEGKNDFEEIIKRIEGATRGITQQFEFWGKKKSGEVFLKDVRLTKGFYFGHERLIATAWDVTERRRSEQALRDSEQRFRMLQEASFGGIGLHDKGKILDCNQGLCELTGYSSEELIGKNGLELIVPELRDFVLEKIMSGYDKPYDVEGLRKDGSRYFLEIKGKNIPFDNRTIRVTEFRDITERKRAEEKIIEQNTKLVAVTEELRRKNAQLEEFTQIVSHNLRSPVGNILSLLSFFESADSEDEKQELLNLLRESGLTTLTMLNELNDVLKIKQSQNIEKQDLKFDNMFHQVRSMLNARITELSANVSSDFSRAPIIQYPTIYLESIMLNLLDNALKYHSPTRKPDIKFTSYTDVNGHTILEAQDNGLGINLERYRHHVFKLRKTFHPHPESRGIGLFMIKNQIDAMGGEISISSEENKGTTFFINFNKHHTDGS
jgi:PAS domain S-box-containing protein